MPRLIILLLALASLTVVTVQNLGADKAVSLVVLGSPTITIPLGLLLLAAVGAGALATLILYGIMGLRRSPESKYKPMGSRVPYPETPSSAAIPDTDSAYDASTTGTQYASTQYGSGASAFVTEPPVDKAGTSPRISSPSSSSSSFVNTPVSKPTDAQSSASTAPSNVYSPFSRSQSPSDNPSPGPAAEKKKPERRVEFPDQNPQASPKASQRESSWADFRPVAQRNSWEDDDYSGPQSTQPTERKGIFDFVRGIGASSASSSPERLAEDIGAGWSEDGASITGYVEGDYRQADYRENYREGDYRERNYPASSYGDEDLDQGWEGYDRAGYQEPRDEPAGYESAGYERKVYGDDLYGPEEPAYREASWEEGPEEDSDSSEVYEADYRVIVPPARPLEDND